MPRNEIYCYKTGFLNVPVSVPVKAASYCAQPQCGTSLYSMCKFPVAPVVVHERIVCPVEQKAVMKSLESI